MKKDNPSATYRLQFNRQFTLKMAIEWVDYFQTLGISHLYASPLFKSTPGSLHGYDILDFASLDPEIGTEEELQTLVKLLKTKGMGLLFDFVPNHMCTLAGNHWWEDVLEKGPISPYAHYFDIVWNPPKATLAGKVLLPILENDYGKEIEQQNIQVVCKEGIISLDYKGRHLPLHPSTWELAKTVKTAKDLDALLHQQHYRLSNWRNASQEINYRRFFEITELAGLQVEKKDVFDAVHAYLFTFIKKGWIDGLRIDHVDGLYDPQMYLKRLHEHCRTHNLNYIIVEKILMGEENLPCDWPVFGTTGYDFLNLLNHLQVDARSKESLEKIYHDFIGYASNMQQTVHDSKEFILTFSMASELQTLARLLEKIAESHWNSNDYTLRQLQDALVQIIACFPVYRSYIAPGEEASEEDKTIIQEAITRAKENKATPAIYDFIETLLLEPDSLPEEQKQLRIPFVMRFQQLTGPVTAKGVEDTSFYRYYPLASLNEVGTDLNLFGLSIKAFHEKNQSRLKLWPHTLLATFTHDTKRSEDVRARMNLLSEKPFEWREALLRWHCMNAKYNSPGKNEEYLLYQTLFGSWPFDYEKVKPEYIERMQAYMVKALREAKMATSWHQPNVDYEEKTKRFVCQILLDPAFVSNFIAFITPYMQTGLWNALNQLVLKATSPGIPDFYQGSELWNLTLVDPDNRRPVDYKLRGECLQALEQTPLDEMIRKMENGCIKMFVTKQLLNKRREQSDLFAKGSYNPLVVRGEKSDQIIAFARKWQENSLICITTRFLSRFDQPTGLTWNNTELMGLNKLKGHYKDLFTGQSISIEEDIVDCSQILHTLPFAVLINFSSTTEPAENTERTFL